ncbi:hypothetical protein QN277_004267 [Acacia crassicarpa]|uniref:Uncharacterized protein n=1 Tax=Acacia crassicarpa TaxID=499986 RepID=A0AAE1J241_9FABA|nr:hypothetical protein QN277_004267 [Acacia crassicarpa]
MANNEYKKKSSSSSSSVCELSMLLVSNIINLSCRSLFGSQGLPPNYSNDPPQQPHDHARLIAESSHHHHDPSGRKVKITQESVDSVIITKPRSYLVKPEQVSQTLTRYDTNNDDVDAYADNYINQVREKINGNHVNH